MESDEAYARRLQAAYDHDENSSLSLSLSPQPSLDVQPRPNGTRGRGSVSAREPSPEERPTHSSRIRHYSPVMYLILLSPICICVEGQEEASPPLK